MLSAFLPAAVRADGFDYSYLGAGYTSGAEPGLGTGQGYLLEGSYAVMDRFFLSAEIRHESAPTANPGGDAGIDRRRLELAFRSAATPSTDLFAGLYLVNLRLDTHDPYFGAMSRNGAGLEFGLRTLTTERWELELTADLDNRGILARDEGRFGTAIDLDARELVLTGALRFHATDRFSVGLDYGMRYVSRDNHSASGGAWLLSGRWYF
ncbi:MAG TPA: hypothetical protein VF651_03025 [Gammaproteobacteria bacterium]